jgi:hypothetical protein
VRAFLSVGKDSNKSAPWAAAGATTKGEVPNLPRAHYLDFS